MSVHPLGILAAPQEFAGARILQIEPGGVAEMASLHVGDLITSVDGKPVRTPMELAAELAGKTGKVRIGIVRGKFVTETEVLLGAQ
jgi:S1-C subfamily serine protease